MRNVFVLVFVLIAIGFVASVGAYIFFKLVDILNSFVSVNNVALPVFAMLSVVVPYLISRLAGFYRGGGTEVVVQSFHGEPRSFSVKKSLGYYIQSIITIGFGGSAGPEGPMVVFGAGVAKAFSRIVKADDDYSKRLLLSGAAAGIVAAFKAPLTGILYALEIPYKIGIEASAFLWSIPTALTAYVVSQLLIEPHIRIKPVRCYVAVDANVILLSIAIGLASAALALLFIAFTNLVEKASKKLGIAAPIALGVALALLILFFPEVRGFGYETINNVINNTIELSVMQLIVLALVKMIATALTIRGGGSGGVFLPTIFMGIVFGAGLTKMLSSLGLETCSELILALATASLLAATSKTLLTSVALTVEVFGFINAIPSLLAAATAYIATIKWSLIKGQQMSRTK